MNRKIGALWLRTSKDGKTNYMSGVLQDLTGDIQIAIFRNDRKEKDNEPDYNILLSEKKQERKVATDPFLGQPADSHVTEPGQYTQTADFKEANKPENIPIVEDQQEIDVNKIPF